MTAIALVSVLDSVQKRASGEGVGTGALRAMIRQFAIDHLAHDPSSSLSAQLPLQTMDEPDADPKLQHVARLDLERHKLGVPRQVRK
ncbi:MAG: hypothetical protein IPF50_10340 [Proteobacteria bacterium]|nr:hypothetical protein [Pseudomonadota bacterium]